MIKVDTKKHCSLNKYIRELYYMKQNINNSRKYTEEEKRLLTSNIEKDIYDAWERIKYDLNKKKG
ncbi:hypothetical protein R0131_14250 [Clostridium sp. AL.422]|uniref:hypothetical protein n=1 Tax=Clostridium TaxID=1485 RepID=UPI00293DE097|nr:MULTISPECIES: hypothetical protein [unclassified Clostridium]MDV4151986.1 hypothetical protein [Clostridium sp. AL.422]